MTFERRAWSTTYIRCTQPSHAALKLRAVTHVSTPIFSDVKPASTFTLFQKLKIFENMFAFPQFEWKEVVFFFK